MPRFAGRFILLAALAPMLAACSGSESADAHQASAARARWPAFSTRCGRFRRCVFRRIEPSSKPSSDAFNPLANPTDTAAGGREVIKNPTVADVMVTGPLPENVAWAPGRTGDDRAKYASLIKPRCRAFHTDTFPEFKRTYIDTGKVRYILEENSRSGSSRATQREALRCAPPDKYFDLYGKFMAQQASWVSQEVRIDPIFTVAKQVGMTRPQLDKPASRDQAMIDGLKWVEGSAGRKARRDRNAELLHSGASS